MTSSKDNYELKQFFMSNLETVYGIQKYLKNELPYMVDSAVTEDVQFVLNVHQKNTSLQLIRLKANFNHLSFKPHKKHSAVIKNMVKTEKRQIMAMENEM